MKKRYSSDHVMQLPLNFGVQIIRPASDDAQNSGVDSNILNIQDYLLRPRVKKMSVAEMNKVLKEILKDSEKLDW